MSTDRKLQLNRVRYVPRHIAHHGHYSGYDRLFERMDLTAARSEMWAKFSTWIPRRLSWRLWSMRPQATQRHGLEAELAAVPWVSMGHDRLCHFIYGEDTFFFTPLWKNGSNKIIATFHYPPDRLIERLNPGSLRALDAVVILGENQRDYFRRYFSDERIHYCPHHVDTEFFHPGSEAQKNLSLRIICVGQLYRDYAFLGEIHHRLMAAGIDAETTIVGQKSLRNSEIADLPGVNIHCNIDDKTLLELYQSSNVGVLPLIDATANNTLLEMMACGLPIVTTAVGGVPTYVHGSAVQTIDKNDSSAFVERILELHGNRSSCAMQGQKNRNCAVTQFSMNRAAQLMTEIYMSVLDS